MICITCPILHEILCIDPICNGYVLVLIEVELTVYKESSRYFLETIVTVRYS
jgi:hypothetical protein